MRPIALADGCEITGQLMIAPVAVNKSDNEFAKSFSILHVDLQVL